VRLEQWLRNERLRRIARYVGYPLFYVFAFWLFVFWTFPHDRLRDRLVAEFNARQTGENPLRLEIEDTSWYWLTGIEAEGVRLTSLAPPPATEEGKTAKPKVVTLDELHARASLLRLIVGTLHLSFGADAFGGKIAGVTSDADEARSIEVEIEDVSVADLPILGEAVGLPLTGVLAGTIDLRLPEGKLSRGEGKIELKITGITVGDGKAKIRDTIALPKLDAGELVLEAEATNGRLKVSKLTAKGPDLELIADGAIRLRDPFESSLAELSLRFKFADSYTNKNDMTRGLFGAPGSSVPGLFDLDPKNRRAKRSDGYYGWRISGPIAHLNFEPAPTAGAGAAAPGAAPMRGFSPRGF
jgi:type II secretion system protein N